MATLEKNEAHPRRLLISTLFLGRLAIDIDRWSIFALLPAVRQAFFVPETMLGLVITMQALPSVVAPALGRVSDIKGRKTMLITGLSILVLSMIMMALTSNFLYLLGARFMVGLAGIIIIPNLIAYLGDKVIYSERGRAVSLVQVSWPLAAILGAPLMTSILNRFGWAWPFFLLGAIALLALVIVSIALPAGSMDVKKSPYLCLTQIKQMIRNRQACTVMLISFLAAAAVNATFTFYSIWLSNVFKLDLVKIGWTSSVSGIGSLVGIILAGILCDKIGKKRTMIFGFGFAALCLSVISWTSTSLYLPLSAAFMFAAAYDMAFIGYYAFLSELLPDSRGLAASLSSTMMAFGSIVGSIGAGFLWATGGFPLITITAALMLFLNTFLVYRNMAEPQRFQGAHFNEQS